MSGASWKGGGRVLAIVAMVACLFIAPSHSRAATTPLPRPFAADSFWNQPLSAGAAVDPRSPQLVAELLRERRIWVPWINTSSYSAPVYVVGPGQARQTVHLDHGGWWGGHAGRRPVAPAAVRLRSRAAGGAPGRR